MLKIKKHKYQVEEISGEHHVRRKSIVWTSQNGRKTVLCDMDSNHIQNALNKIERGELDSRITWIKDLENELKLRIKEKYGE